MKSDKSLSLVSGQPESLNLSASDVMAADEARNQTEAYIKRGERRPDERESEQREENAEQDAFHARSLAASALASQSNLRKSASLDSLRTRPLYSNFA
ncbi:MAG TPA: hypothetical protein VGC89_17680 [Pyrinomonadaceae bacterium]